MEFVCGRVLPNLDWPEVEGCCYGAALDGPPSGRRIPTRRGGMMDRLLIGPAPAFPTPWRLAENRDGYQIVVTSEGCEAFRCSSEATDLAELVVELVNGAGELAPVPLLGQPKRGGA